MLGFRSCCENYSIAAAWRGRWGTWPPLGRAHGGAWRGGAGAMPCEFDLLLEAEGDGGAGFSVREMGDVSSPSSAGVAACGSRFLRSVSSRAKHSSAGLGRAAGDVGGWTRGRNGRVGCGQTWRRRLVSNSERVSSTRRGGHAQDWVRGFKPTGDRVGRFWSNEQRGVWTGPSFNRRLTSIL